MEQQTQRTKWSWKWAILILAVADLWGSWFVQKYAIRGTNLSRYEGIPSNVVRQYLQAKPNSYVLWRATLQQCARDNKVAYRLLVGGGGSGEEYFFDEYGKLLGTFGDSDVHGPGYQGPSISLSDCKTIEQRGKGLK